jgi:hypothetical protein
MQPEISKGEKACMFFWAALGGSISAGSFTAAFLIAVSSGWLPLDAGWMPYVGPGFCLLGVIVLQMVVGAWSSALSCALWRSAAGKRLFSTLSGGVLGGVLSIFLLLPASAGVPLVPTFVGLLVGDLVGRYFERRCERALHTLTEGLD